MAYQKSVIAVQVTVKGYPFNRRVKEALIAVNPGRKMVPYKCTKPRNNDTIVPEEKFPDVYAYILRHEEPIINKDMKQTRFNEGKKG
jgi:hypothetical protein